MIKRRKRSFWSWIGNGFIKVRTRTITKTEYCQKELPLQEVINPSMLKFDNKGDGLDLGDLAKAVEIQSLRSIREKLAGIIGDIFAYLKGIFQHIKKIFYIVSICMMVYDGYK